MKKTFYSLLAFATLLLAASCAKEPANVADPAFGGKPVATTFSVSLGGALTKADPIPGSSMDDGSLVNTLYVAAFDSEGELISTSKTDGSITVKDGKADVTLVLSKGVTYQLVFFAEVAGKYGVEFSKGVAKFSYPDGVLANDPELDAFYKTMEYTPNGKKLEEDVFLYRPFAQVNFLTIDDPNKLPDNKTEYSSTLKVTGAPTTFDLLEGKAEEPAQNSSLSFGSKVIDATPVGVYAPGGAKQAKWIGMNFILVPESGKVDLEFQEASMTQPLTLTEISVSENGRTNLYGNIYELDGYTFHVEVKPEFGSETNGSTDAVTAEYIVGTTGAYPEDAPLSVSAEQTVSVTIKNVEDAANPIGLSDVNANPAVAGEQVEVKCEPEAVADVAVVGDDVKITPKANGKAKITISTPAFTKALYGANSTEFWIVVTGMANAEQTLHFENDEGTTITDVNVVKGETPLKPVLKGAQTKVTYSTGDGELDATVNPDTGEVTFGEGVGSIEITATAEEGLGEDGLMYGEASATYTLTVLDNKKDVAISLGMTGFKYTLKVKESSQFTASASIEGTGENVEIQAIPYSTGIDVELEGNTVTVTGVHPAESAQILIAPVNSSAYNCRPVYVSVTVNKGDPNLTVSGNPDEATSDPVTLSVTNDSDASVSATVNGETLQPGEDGKYTIAPPEGLTGETTVTVVFSVTETDDFEADSEEVSITFKPAGGETPSTFTVTDLTTIISAADDANITFNAIVAAVSNDSFVATDGTNYFYVYKPNLVPAVGDGVSVTGVKTTYNNIVETKYKKDGDTITAQATVEVVVNNQTVPTPTAKDANDIDNYTNTNKVSEFVTYSGELIKSGNYYNVIINPDATKKGSVNAVEGIADAVGHMITVKGFVTGNSNSYLTLLVTDLVTGDIVTKITGLSNQSLLPEGEYEFAAETNNPNGTILYSIVEGSDIVDLSGNKVTVKANATAGSTAKIKATVAKTPGYTAAEAVATITVKDAGATTPDPEEIVFANLGLENGVQYTDPFNGDSFTITFAGGGNDGKYYTAGSGVRTYGGGTITIKSSYSIAKIEFSWDGSNKPTSNDVVNTGTFNSDYTEWTGEATEVVLTRPTGSGHWRLQSVKVTYK